MSLAVTVRNQTADAVIKVLGYSSYIFAKLTSRIVESTIMLGLMRVAP